MKPLIPNSDILDLIMLQPTPLELVSMTKNNALGIELNQEYYNAVLEKFVKPGSEVLVFGIEKD
jgi:hypothetical protein